MSGLALELQEVTERLGESELSLLIEIARRFLNDDDDTLTELDLHYIALGDEEYARGETVSHSQRKWKQ